MRRREFLTAAGATLTAGLAMAGCDGGPATPGPSTTTASAPSATPPATPTASAQTIADGLQVPWSIAFLPGGDALVSERNTGRILRIPAAGGTPAEVMRIPGVATDTAEGGLLGLAVPTPYDGMVYAYYTTRTDNRLVRFTLGGPVQPLLTGLRRGTIHNGGRIAFGPDGKLYAGVGETGDRGLAQDRSALNGKILRIEPDGAVPTDNPFPGSPVWTYGHRNVQGMAWDSAGRMWATEFGQDRFDEVNLIEPGRNYGWPDVEGVADTAGGRYTNPVVVWPTDQASPSGAAILGDTLYVGALRGQRLWPVRLDGTTATAGTPLLHNTYGRIRAVTAAPDGRLWISTSNRDGRGSPHRGDDRIIALTV